MRVYRFVSNGWSQVGSDLDGEQEFDSFYATNLSADGTTLAVAAPNNDDSANNAGHVKTYSLISESSPNPVDIFSSTIKNTATNISLVSSDSDYDNLTYSITGTSANPAYGSVTLDGSIATYTPNTGFEGTDSFYYAVSDGISTSSDKLVSIEVFASYTNKEIQIGSDIDGEAENDYLGQPHGGVVISGNGKIVAVAASYNDGAGTNAGQVRVFQNNNGSWSQLGDDIEGEAARDRAGAQKSISLSDDGLTLAVGFPLNDDSGTNYGKVRVYEYQSGCLLYTSPSPRD